ncbi:MAG: 16S rRNA (cytidine(1402)-2'-O)-methyltransferase [Acidobacteriota bacterium]
MTEAPPQAGTLFVVATPIGNLADVSTRARQVLTSVSLIACEDTRVTSRLLDRAAITTPTVAYHAHNESSCADRVLALLSSGRDVALVSDAGTPVVSDPGSVLVRRAHEGGIPVVAVPGPSALVSALSVSGLPARPFTFAGFLPSRAGERGRTLEALGRLPHTLVLFEAPHRLRASLADMAARLGPRDAAVCRELTKVHEEVVRGRLDDLAARFASRDSIRGEITVVIGPPTGAPAPAAGPAPDLATHLRDALTRTAGRRKDALRLLARERGVSRRTIYRELLDAGLLRRDREPGARA